MPPAVPAGQRFDADKRKGLGVDDGLIDDLDFAARNGRPKIELQQIAGLARLVHLRVIESPAASSSILGGIHRHVGPARQLRAVDAAGRRRAETDAAANHDHSLAKRQWLVKEGENGVGQSRRTHIKVGAGEHDGKFVATDTSECRFRTDKHSQASGHGPDQAVAGCVTIGVVDLLEAIEIEIEQDDIGLVGAGGLDALLQQHAQAFPIGKPAQPVCQGELHRDGFVGGKAPEDALADHQEQQAVDCDQRQCQRH